MINDLPTIYEVVTGAAKKQSKEKSAVSNHSSSKPKSNPKVLMYLCFSTFFHSMTLMRTITSFISYFKCYWPACSCEIYLLFKLVFDIKNRCDLFNSKDEIGKDNFG